MSRRAFLQSCLGLAVAAGLPALSAAAEPFRPSRISVQVVGEGPDVVLIPGLTASRGVWAGTVKALPGYRYHLVQVAGFAGEPARGNAAGPVAAPVAEEIARYIAARGLHRPAVVGHSMGGTIAMMLAARHPQAAGRVMVVDMVPAPAQLFGASAASVRPLAGLLRDEALGTDRLWRELRSAIGRFGSADWMATRSDPSVVARSLEELIGTDLTPELARVQAPMTVVYACPEPVALTRGALDRLYLGAYASHPQARLIRIARSGHTIMADQPQVFRRVLGAFLAGR